MYNIGILFIIQSHFIGIFTTKKHLRLPVSWTLNTLPTLQNEAWAFYVTLTDSWPHSLIMMESRNLCWRRIFVAVIEILQSPRFSNTAVGVFPFPRRLKPSVLYAILPTDNTVSIISSAYIISLRCDVLKCNSSSCHLIGHDISVTYIPRVL
jgi:hypothetical protein